MYKTTRIARFIAVLILVFACPASSFGDQIENVSVSTGGVQGDNYSTHAYLSSNGRYVTFYSLATNLVPNDNNGKHDVFVRDRLRGITERVSVASDGTEGDDKSGFSAISDDGRYVAFRSYATNLVPNDNNGARDIFVHDRETGTTERVSVASDGTEGDDCSTEPSISSDGRYVAFYSYATNFVPNDNNGVMDIFVHDRETGTTERVSVASDGTEGDSFSTNVRISGDGRYVTFSSSATNLVPNDNNGKSDVFVHDRETGATERVSVASDGTEGNNTSELPGVSYNGRYVTFSSHATNLVPSDNNGEKDAFVHDRLTGKTKRVSVASNGTEGNSISDWPKISSDGQYVTFYSSATNLVPNDTNGKSDIFVHDHFSGETERVSVASDGTEADAYSSYPVLSYKARQVAFYSPATNLVPNDTNGYRDVFVREYKPVTIPTMTEWGMIVMAVLMALSALVIRKRLMS